MNHQAIAAMGRHALAELPDAAPSPALYSKPAPPVRYFPTV